MQLHKLHFFVCNLVKPENGAIKTKQNEHVKS
jgi:hypothetical protein